MLLTSGANVALTAFGASRPVNALEPATVILIAQTAQKLLSTGHRSLDSDGVIQRAQLDPLQQIRSRLDAIWLAP